MTQVAYIVAKFDIEAPEGRYQMLTVECPRKACGRTFWAGLDWAEVRYIEGASDSPPARVTGRPCPYCSKAAAIPESFQTEPVIKSQQGSSKKKIVKRKKAKK